MDQNTVYIDDSAKEILKENMYSGTGYLKTKEEVLTGSYAKMQVSGADTIIPENIKENETILGVTGSYEGVVEKQYIYEKGQDSEVEFELHSIVEGYVVPQGTNLMVGASYDFITQFYSNMDIYINGNLVAEDVDDNYYITITEDMSVNNKVVITVKRHE